MEAKDQYKTVEHPATGIFRDKGSKFIAYIYPISAETEIKPILLQLKAEHPKARHHCWAYRLGMNTSNYRLNDDGEPSGTAGRPILNSLLSTELTNVFVVVVRYFGGTLLGVPGLINAYKSATIDAIENSNIIEKTENLVYSVRCDYLQLNQVMRIIKESSLVVKSQTFDLECSFLLEVRKALAQELLGKLDQVDQIKIEQL
ncbi:YigZ family protein [Pedobacter sp. SAFR-022]|uniref:YigZ family protein n=1 Tax=Pedobacter sp. SAFR-022 TaxID=3436861 RepID=UPI003F7D2797